MKETASFPFLTVCFPFSTSSGDVLQLSFPLRGAVLFPGQGFNAEGISGWNHSHVHSQGETDRTPCVSNQPFQKMLNDTIIK